MFSIFRNIRPTSNMSNRLTHMTKRGFASFAIVETGATSKNEKSHKNANTLILTNENENENVTGKLVGYLTTDVDLNTPSSSADMHRKFKITDPTYPPLQ